jgi:hypothetical protein
MKKIVNALESSNVGTHGKRDMRMVVKFTDATGNEVAREVPVALQLLHDVYKRSECSEHDNALMINPNLSDANFIRTPHSRMNVALAARVLSNRMVVMCEREINGRAAVDATKGSSYGRGDKALDLLGVRDLCKHFNELFDIMNGRTSENHHGWITGPNDIRLDALIRIQAFVEQWRTDIYTKYATQPKSIQQLFFLPHQCYFDVKLLCSGFVAFCKNCLDNSNATLSALSDGKFRIVQPKRCNQDVLENHFGHMRGEGGSGRNPDHLQCEGASAKSVVNRGLGYANQSVRGSNVAHADEEAEALPLRHPMQLVRYSTMMK